MLFSECNWISNFFSLFGEEEMVHGEVNLFKNVFEWKFQHLEIAPKLGMGNRPASIAYFFHISNNAGKVIWKFFGSKLARKCFFSHRNRLHITQKREVIFALRNIVLLHSVLLHIFTNVPLWIYGLGSLQIIYHVTVISHNFSEGGEAVISTKVS